MTYIDVAKAAHSSPEITRFCRHSRGVWGPYSFNSADITAKHMADTAMLLQLRYTDIAHTDLIVNTLYVRVCACV